MGELTKKTFRDDVDFECDRRLLLELGRDDGGWLSPLREIAPPPPELVQRRARGAEPGKRYEQQVYDRLRHDPRAIFQQSDGRIVQTALTAPRLRELAARVQAGDGLLLLEHEWAVGEGFVREVFGLAAEAPIPVRKRPAAMRPDLIVLRPGGQESSGAVWALRGEEQWEELSREEASRRVAIQLLDIKHVHEQSVGRSHFTELLVYAHALACFLREQGLEEVLYVSLEGHGIVPNLEDVEVAGLSWERLGASVVPMVWRDVSHLYKRTCERIRELYAASPRPLEAAEVHIQSSCGRCGYLNDCAQTLGYTGRVTAAEEEAGSAAAAWDLRLLPLTSRSVAEQLRARGLETLGDVAAGGAALEPGPVPEPLFAELPTLLLKAQALVSGTALAPEEAHTGGQRYRSLAVPRYSQLNLFFDLETDPSTERVFAAGLLFVARAGERMPWEAPFRRLLEALRAQLGGRRTARLDPAPLRAALDPDYLAHPVIQGIAAEADALLLALAEALRALQEEASVAILLPGEPLPYDASLRSSVAELRVQWSNLNGGLGLEDEHALAADLIRQLDRLITVAVQLEGLAGVVRPGSDGKTYTVSPDFAGFYWSSEQVQHGKALMERHLRTLLHDDDLREPFMRIVHWMAPLDSAVEHFEVRKKLFDLRDFVESTLGLPEIINYAWHSVDRRLQERQGRWMQRYDPGFWAAHFNYMDFMPWYHLLDERNVKKQARLQTELMEQIDLKVGALARILGNARHLSGEHIAALRQRPVNSQRLRGTPSLGGMHPLARAWYLYARLSNAAQGLEAEHIRTTFPAWSINRLRAAEVSGLAVQRRGAPETYRASFLLAGLSAHVKVSEGDTVLLIPAEIRDQNVQEQWTVTLEEMTWSPAEAGWRCVVCSGSVRKLPHPLLRPQAPDGEPPWAPEGDWFVYPSVMEDYWSKRLLKLLGAHHLGDAWLGERLAFLHRLSDAPAVEPPPARAFTAPEVYAYAPGLLPAGAPVEGPLLTTVHPSPDPSQLQAIRVALGRTLTCLQGPPGTGKSATIAALIDAFLHRHAAAGGGPARVLVTAFSYQAMRVVLDKVLESRDASGAPTLAAQTRCVFMRSSRREPLEAPPGARLSDLWMSGNDPVLDGVRLSRSKGKRLDNSLLPEPFVLFANAHSLVKLAEGSKSAKFDYNNLSNGFGFDLIIVDEASQLPMDQALAALALVKPAAFGWTLETDQPTDAPIASFEVLRSLRLEGSGEALTRVVVVGDQHQLPPVQPVKPPERLRPFLSSVFSSLIGVHEVGFEALSVNYRSHPTIVDYTRDLGIYRGLQAFQASRPLPALPPVPLDLEGPAWMGEVLDPARVVSTILLDERFNTALSPREAELTAQLAVAFRRQLAPADAAAERRFWAEELGVVSPHNAQGRLITRRIHGLLTESPAGRQTHLSDQELVEALRATIYSVEKFQGSDRTFIIASFGISARDQLQAEEGFIYDLNRFNVLTSRAKQKMLLLCSRSFLDYTPRDREIMAYAARIRDYALRFCDQRRTVDGLEIRWRA